jgi:hypothetical protein
MRGIVVIIFAFFLLMGLPAFVSAQSTPQQKKTQANELPSVLTCTSNAKASRDYGFLFEKRWLGIVGGKPNETFGVGTQRVPNGQILRDKVFSELNTARPTVRSIPPAGGGQDEDAAEFVGTVLNRDVDSVWISWRNPPGNKVWLSVIDLQHKKAVVAQLFSGLTSVGGEIETLDCR